MGGPNLERETKLAPISSLVSQSLTSARLVLGAKVEAFVCPVGWASVAAFHFCNSACCPGVRADTTV